MSSVYPGAYSVYQPSIEASGKLMVDFSRNPKTFEVNQYSQIIKVEKNSGLYIQHTPDEAARALTSDGSEFVWADGTASPDNYIQKEFTFPSYTTKRFAFPFTLGDLTVEQAAWDIVSNYAATAASLAMTQRTRLAIAALTTGLTGNQTATATSLGGGVWDAGAGTAPYLRKGLLAASQQILQATNGVVQPSDLAFVINPHDAAALAASVEVIDFIKQQVGVVESLKMEGNYGKWGLPETLFGLRLIVEDCVYVSSAKTQTRAQSYAIPNKTGFVISRIGAMETTNGTFSTLCMFAKEEMTVELLNDAINRRVIGRVVEDIDFEVTAPISGLRVTGLTT